jgi:hypothetical protein
VEPTEQLGNGSWCVSPRADEVVGFGFGPRYSTYLPRYLIKERGEETGGRMVRNT